MWRLIIDIDHSNAFLGTKIIVFSKTSSNQIGNWNSSINEMFQRYFTVLSNKVAERMECLLTQGISFHRCSHNTFDTAKYVDWELPISCPD